jgi:cell division transport system permease protein
LLDDVAPDLLPASFEIRLASEGGAKLPALVALLTSLPGVAHIDHLGSWAARLDAIASLLQGGLLMLTLFVTLAGLYVVASATRIGILSRAEEIRIQRLLGGSDRFVNAPLLLEGLIQGCVAVALALALLYALFAFIAPRIDDALAPLTAGAHLQFFGPAQIAVALLAGGAIGLLGSRLAISQSARVH